MGVGKIANQVVRIYKFVQEYFVDRGIDWDKQISMKTHERY